jgi:hypothetical protein
LARKLRVSVVKTSNGDKRSRAKPMGAVLDTQNERYVNKLLRRIKESSSGELDTVLHDSAQKLYDFMCDVCEKRSDCNLIVLKYLDAVVARGETRRRAVAIWLKHAVNDLEFELDCLRKIDVEPNKEMLESYRSLKREFILASS